MERLGGMEEVGRGAGGAEGSGDFAGDQARFADTEEDDLVAAGDRFDEEIDCAGEGHGHRAIEADGEFEQGAGLYADQIGGTRG